MKLILTNGSAVLALVSAVLWFVACFVRMKYKPKVDKDGWTSAAFISGDADVFETARLQTKWNAWAAACAGLASASQAMLIWLY